MPSDLSKSYLFSAEALLADAKESMERGYDDGSVDYK